MAHSGMVQPLQQHVPRVLRDIVGITLRSAQFRQRVEGRALEGAAPLAELQLTLREDHARRERRQVRRRPFDVVALAVVALAVLDHQLGGVDAVLGARARQPLAQILAQAKAKPKGESKGGGGSGSKGDFKKAPAGACLVGAETDIKKSAGYVCAQQIGRASCRERV